MAGNPGDLEFDELLDQVADTMWGVIPRIEDPEGAREVAVAADHVHSIVLACADVLSALSHWYERHDDELFDADAGAEVDARRQAGEAAIALRELAACLREDAARSRDALGALRSMAGRRVLYAVDPAELEDEDEVYAVCEVDYATAHEEDLELYARLDVARFAARQIARRGAPGTVYRVVPIIGGERQGHVAEWPGKGERDA